MRRELLKPSASIHQCLAFQLLNAEAHLKVGGKRAEMGSCNYCCFCALLVPLGSCSHEYIIHHNFGGTGAELGEEAGRC